MDIVTDSTSSPMGAIEEEGSNILLALSNIHFGLILTIIKFPFTAIWWTITNIFSLPYIIASWSAWILSLPFKIVAWVVHFLFAPLRLFFGSPWIPWPWNWSLEAVIDTIGPVLTIILIASTVGILAGIFTYFLALSLSAITSAITESIGPFTSTSPRNTKTNKITPKLLQSHSQSQSGKQTPQYDTEDEENFKTELNLNFDHPLNTSRRSSISFTDFDTDDASSLLQPRNRSGQGKGKGAELYAAWRERVDSARLSPGPTKSSGTAGVTLTSPPPGMVLSPGAGGGGGGASSSKKRLPGLLFGTTIHEEDDDSL
ncbi:hypothetical protein V8F20_007807 [Naviculisporaceae sp. PSN 640]